MKTQNVNQQKPDSDAGKSSPALNPTRLMAMPLGNPLLGIEVTAAVYAKNGFRFIATTACIDLANYETESQKFRNIYKLDPDAALNSAIQTGYDSYVQLEDILNYLAKLNDPRCRIVCELFWPHISGEAFDRIKKHQHISCAEVLQLLNDGVVNHQEPDNGIATHALAVAHHNRAISYELAFASGNERWNGGYWQSALSYWAELLELDPFWKYLGSRADSFDDPRLNAKDIQLLRAQLPLVLLEFNALFARAYAKAKQTEASARHISLINNSRLPNSAKQECLSSLVQSLAATRLEPLTQRVNSGIMEKSGRQNRQEIDKVCTPVLRETLAVRDYLLDELKFSPQMIKLAEFDRLCELIGKALDTKINYDSDDRVRSILYSSLITKKLLLLPLSSSLRRKFEQSLDRDADILYDEFLSDSDSKIDPTQCWFLGGEEADPDASIEFSVHKVTEVKGTSVRWQMRRILVPRSKLAAKFHQGKLTLKKLATARQDDKSKSIRAEIERIRVESEQTIKGIEERRDQSIRQQTDALENQLKTFNKRIASKETKHNTYIAKIQSQLEKDIANEGEKLQKARLDVKNKTAAPIAEAEAEYKQFVKDTRGLHDGIRLELPAMAISSLVMSFAAYTWGISTLLGLLIAGGVTGIVSGILIGRVIRGVRRRKAALPLKKLKQKLDDELTRLNKAYQETILKLRKAADKTAGVSRAALDAFNAERAEMKTRSDNTIGQLRNQAESEINSIRKTAAQKIKPLQEKLETYLKPKPESKKKSFPPYKTAKSKGYKDGIKPSDYEINRLVDREFEKFKNSLSYEERNALALMAEYLGNQEFNKFINALMSLSPSERRAKLSALNLLRNLRGY